MELYKAHARRHRQGGVIGGEEAQLLDLAQEAEEGPHLLRAGAGRDVGDLDHVGAAAGGHRAAARSAGAAADTAGAGSG